MLVKTSTLIGHALDWAVLKASGQDFTDFNLRFIDAYPFSTDWTQGGPLIEQGKIDLYHGGGKHAAAIWKDEPGGGKILASVTECPTPLIAAMRCYVASKLGDRVKIPDELQGE